MKQSDSTGKTSVDSKNSSSKDRSSEKRSPLAKWKTQQHIPQVPPETANSNLGTIQEKEDDQIVTPTVVTAERAAAAKIYLETYYNELFTTPSQRDRRLRLMEGELWHLGDMIPPNEKERMRKEFFRNESNHLRQTRVLKARTAKALAGSKSAASSCYNDYQNLKALGKGSFGVVKLVRKKPRPGDDLSKQKVYAMKVIRKSGMLHTSQEGHLRAERDFLVASEGSDW